MVYISREMWFLDSISRRIPRTEFGKYQVMSFKKDKHDMSQSCMHSMMHSMNACIIHPMHQSTGPSTRREIEREREVSLLEKLLKNICHLESKDRRG
jgi:hypothetical protein